MAGVFLCSFAFASLINSRALNVNAHGVLREEVANREFSIGVE